MKKILFAVVALTILIITVVQVTIWNTPAASLFGSTSTFSSEDSDELYEADPVPVKEAPKTVKTAKKTVTSTGGATATGEAPPKSTPKTPPKAEEKKLQKNLDSKKIQEIKKSGVTDVDLKSVSTSKVPTIQTPAAPNLQKPAEAPITTQLAVIPVAQKTDITIFGTPSVYTQPGPAVLPSTSQIQTAPEQVAITATQETPPPAYVLDTAVLRQISPQLKQWEQTYNLPPTVENVVNQTLGTRDTDGDGLSDFEEGRLGINPNSRDTDGDGFSDSDEVLTYHSNPRDKNNPPGKVENGILKVDTRKIGIRITGFLDNQLISDDRPIIKGVAPAGEVVEVIATDENKQKFVLGRVKVSENNVFVLESWAVLPDADYTFTARMVKKVFSSSDILAQVAGMEIDQDKSLNDSPPVRAKIQSKLDVNPPTPKKLADQLLESEVLIKNVRVEIRDRKPRLLGKTSYGSEVLTTWSSLVMTSALIADTSAGDFEIQPQAEMELGEHDVYIQAVRPKDGALSKTIKVSFKIEQPAAQQTVETPSTALKPAAEPVSNNVQKPLAVKGGIQAFMEKQNALLWSITGVVLLVIIIAGTIIFVSGKRKNNP